MRKLTLTAVVVAGLLALLFINHQLDTNLDDRPMSGASEPNTTTNPAPKLSRQPVQRSIAVQSVTAPGAASADNAPPYAPDHILVKFRPETPKTVIDTVVQKIDGSVVQAFRAPGLFLIKLPDSVTVADAQAYFVKDKHVERVEKDLVYHLLDTPDDSDFDLQWGLHNTGQDGGVADVDVNAPEAWIEVTGSRDFVIGVIDSGVQIDHPDLTANLWTNPGEIAANGIDDDGNGYVDDIHGIDQIFFDGAPEDNLGHGTHVSGTIAAVGNNGIGVAGVMWDANVLSCKIFSEYGWTTLSRVLTCMDYMTWASDAGHNVVAVNASWGGYGFSWNLYDAIAELAARDILFVAAAGNESNDNDGQYPHYPSSYDLDNIISVAAIGRRGDLAEFSNHGAQTVDIAAPGVDILSTVLFGGWDSYNGTSMAAPHVTGAIGMIKASAPAMTGQEIKAHLLATSVTSPALAGKVASDGRLRLELPFIDLDGDLISDRWEDRFGFDSTDASDAALDPDADGLDNLAEYNAKTDPTLADTDGDTLNDGDELNTYGTDPLDPDSDDDGLDDAEEVLTYSSNPFLADTDFDGLSDQEETETVGSDPLLDDSDGDGLLDGFEVQHDLDPLVSGEQDQDTDADGLTTLEEQAESTDPANPDTDGDGLSDGDEVNAYLTNPVDVDTDDDQLSDRWEIENALLPTDPADQRLDPDTDGYTNLEEFFNNSDPNDVSSFPSELSWSGQQGNARRDGFVPTHTSTPDFGFRWIRVLPRFADGLPNGTRYSSYYTRSVDGTKSLVEYSMATAESGWIVSMPSVNRVSIDENSLYYVVRNLSIGDRQLLAWDRATGEPLYDAVSLNAPGGASSVTVDSGEAFIQNVSDLLKLDADSGAELWRTPIASSSLNDAPEVAVDEKFVVMSAGDGQAQVFDRATGTLQHDIDIPQCLLRPEYIAVDDIGSAYVLCEFVLSRIDLDEGVIKWQVSGPRTISGLAVDGQHVYVSNWWDLYALDRESGAVKWYWESPGRTSGNIVVTLDHVFVGIWAIGEENPERTVAIDLETREQVWELGMPGHLGMTGDGALLVKPENSNVLAVVDTRGDTDGDGLKDWWEHYYDLDFADAADAALDPDGDGLSNTQEYLAGTDPRLTDTDADGLSDGTEVNLTGSDPTLADSDADGLADGEEVNVYGTAPDNVDSDGDGYQDGDEVDVYGTNPTSPDNSPEPAEPPFGSSYANVLVVSDNKLHEYRPDGEPARSSIDIPQAIDARDLVVLPDHRIVISDAPYLHIYDPALRRFSIAMVDEWKFGSNIYTAPIATSGSDILLSVTGGFGFGIIKRLDRNGVLLETVKTNSGYKRIHLGYDGYLYGQLSDDGRYEKLDPNTLQTLQSMRLETPSSSGLAVTAAGNVYSVAKGVVDSVSEYKLIEKYSASGVLQNSRRLLMQGQPNDLALTESGPLYSGSTDGTLMIVSRDFQSQDSVRISPSSIYQIPVFVTSIPSAGKDTDGDGMPDWWERAHDLDLSNALDGAMDPDGDDLSNLDEFAADGDPADTDTDGDGLTDGEEVSVWFTSVTASDTDHDGLSDFNEVTVHGTNPLEQDSDGDGVYDHAELMLHGSDPLSSDTDGDGLSDGEERRYYLSITDATDVAADFDSDGLTNIAEIGAGTDLRNWDSDNDLLSDGDELNVFGTDPLDRDSDADHMPDGWERRFGFDAMSDADAEQDPDGDGFVNRVEYYASSEPDDAVSVPVPEQWRTDQGNAGHTAYVPVRLDPDNFSLEWSTPTEPGTEVALRQAIVGRDQLFVSQPRRYTLGNHLLTSFNRWTGALEWQHDFGNVSDLSGPAIDSNTVYTRSGDGPDNSYVWAFNQDDGNIRFQTPITSNLSSVRSPVVVGNGLYAPIGKGGIGRFDTDSGDLVWFLKTDDRDGDDSPTVVGGHVYTYSSGKDMLNVIAADTGVHGYSIWNTKSGPAGSIFGSAMPGSSGNMIMVEGGQVTSIDLATRKVAWTSPVESYKAAAIANGVIYAAESNALVAIDERDGSVLWRWPVLRNIVSDVVATVDHVFFATDVETFAIQTATAKADWSYPAGGQLSISADNVLYIAGQDGVVTAISTQADSDGDHVPDTWEQRFGFNANDASDAETDADGDGLTQRDEYLARTNPHSTDSDGDGISDAEEMEQHGTNPISTDSDGDGLTDVEEIVTWGTDPLSIDSDEDGISDNREISAYGTDPVSKDSDGDSWSDSLEIDRGSDPSQAASAPPPVEDFMESFEDGSMSPRFQNASSNLNGWEISDDGDATDGRYFIRPTFVDTEMATEFTWEDNFADGILTYRVKVENLDCCHALQVYLDGQLVESIEQPQGWREHFIRMVPGRHVVQWRMIRSQIPATGPLRTRIDLIRYSEPDRDADGMSTDWELTYGLDPEDSSDRAGDADGDTLSNIEEFERGTSPTSADTDGDGMPDAWEIDSSLDPLSADALEDLDGDGLNNKDEYSAGTLAQNPDTDNDQMPDGWEMANGLDPLMDDAAADLDGDGTSNLDEYLAGTDPDNASSAPSGSSGGSNGGNSSGGGSSTGGDSGGGAGAGDVQLLFLLFMMSLLGRRRRHSVRSVSSIHSDAESDVS